MKKKIIIAFGIFILFLVTYINPSVAVYSIKKPIDGNTLYVGGTGPGNYTKIQDAVDNASAKDIVYVFNGTYNERVKIYNSLKLIGEDRNNTIIDANG